MERKKKESGVKPIWKKVTRGTLYPFATQRNVKVTQNGTVQASEEEIEKFREHFVLKTDGTGSFKTRKELVAEKKSEDRPVKKPKKYTGKNKKLGDLKNQTSPPVDPAEKEVYEIVEIEGEDDLYNVVSPAGKVMNSEPMSRKDAEETKTALEESTEEE